jgi:translation initiation factor 2B subunit (eIF-2B alpha/beta/delta family)
VDINYLKSVAGVFNIVGVLAHMHRNGQLQGNVDTAQQVLLGLIEEKRPPTPEEATLLRQVFNQADRYIGIQNTVSMAKAIRYTDREIAAGRTTLISSEIG